MTAHPQLNLSNDALLSTTRAVRKRLDFDREVPMSVIEECLELALQAPSGSNGQGWHFMLVTEPEKKTAIADYYREAFSEYRSGPRAPTQWHKNRPDMKDTQERVLNSAQYLADNLHRAPALLIPCINGRVNAEGIPIASQASMYASVIPASWNFMLAARARGLGTCWTTLHLNYEEEIAKLLGIPYDKVSQIAVIPIAYSVGNDFKPGPRKTQSEVVHINNW